MGRAPRRYPPLDVASQPFVQVRRPLIRHRFAGQEGEPLLPEIQGNCRPARRLGVVLGLQGAAQCSVLQEAQREQAGILDGVEKKVDLVGAPFRMALR